MSWERTLQTRRDRAAGSRTDAVLWPRSTWPGQTTISTLVTLAGRPGEATARTAVTDFSHVPISTRPFAVVPFGTPCHAVWISEIMVRHASGSSWYGA
jgi:hypothetical protein